MSDFEPDIQGLTAAAEKLGLSMETKLQVHGSDELLSIEEATKRCPFVGSMIMKLCVEYADMPDGHEMARKMLGVVEAEPIVINEAQPIEAETKISFNDEKPKIDLTPDLFAREDRALKLEQDVVNAPVLKLIKSEEPVQAEKPIEKVVAAKPLTIVNEQIEAGVVQPHDETLIAVTTTDIVPTVEVVVPDTFAVATQDEVAPTEEPSVEEVIKPTEFILEQVEEAIDVKAASALQETAPAQEDISTEIIPDETKPEIEVTKEHITDIVHEELVLELEIKPESESTVIVERISEVIKEFVFEVTDEEPMTVEVLEAAIVVLVEKIIEQSQIEVSPEQKQQLIRRLVHQAVELRAQQLLVTQLEEGTNEHRHAGMHLPQLVDDIHRTNSAASFLGGIILRLKPIAA